MLQICNGSACYATVQLSERIVSYHGVVENTELISYIPLLSLYLTSTYHKEKQNKNFKVTEIIESFVFIDLIKN